MKSSPESIINTIFYKKGGNLGFTEGFGVEGLLPSQIEMYVSELVSKLANREVNTLNIPGEVFNKLQDLKYLYSIYDDYGYDTDNLKYSNYYNSFTGKNYLDLFPIIQKSSEGDWKCNFHYYFALLDYIQDDIDSKGLVIGFQYLNE